MATVRLPADSLNDPPFRRAFSQGSGASDNGCYVNLALELMDFA
jgi:hypothetical protein